MTELPTYDIAEFVSNFLSDKSLFTVIPLYSATVKFLYPLLFREILPDIDMVIHFFGMLKTDFIPDYHIVIFCLGEIKRNTHQYSRQHV